MQLVTSKLQPVLIYRSPNPRALRRLKLNLLCLCLINGVTVWMTAHLFTTWSPEYCKPTIETYRPETKVPSLILLLTDKARGQPRALMETYKINVVFMVTNTAFILQPMGQGVILTFKSYYLRKIFHKSVAAIISDSCDGSGKAN